MDSFFSEDNFYLNSNSKIPLKFEVPSEIVSELDQNVLMILTQDLKELLPYIIEKEYFITKELILVKIINREFIIFVKNYKSEYLKVYVDEEKIKIQDFILLKFLTKFESKCEKISKDNEFLREKIKIIYDNIYVFEDSPYMRVLLKDYDYLF